MVGLVWSRGCHGDDRRSRGPRRDERDDEPEARRGGNVSEERASREHLVDLAQVGAEETRSRRSRAVALYAVRFTRSRESANS